jgi:hypothetical protein
MEQVQDLDNAEYFNRIEQELRDKYYRLDLMNNYSMLVIQDF